MSRVVLSCLLVLIAVRGDCEPRTAHLDFRLPADFSPGPGSPHLAFCSRLYSLTDRTPGHAFVELYFPDETMQATRMLGYGWYPRKSASVDLNELLDLSSKKNLENVFQPVPGELRDDIYESPPDAPGRVCRFFVRLTPAQAAAIERTIKSYAETHEYQIASDDCVTFLEALARSAGLKTPDRSGLRHLPHFYVERLAELNAPGGGVVLP